MPETEPINPLEDTGGPATALVLQNEDILEHIFSFFGSEKQYGSIQSMHQALLFACLTCRSFFKPASDLLWREISLEFLLKILPTVAELNDSFNGVIRREHIDRFKMYGRKIRALRIQSILPNVVERHCVRKLLGLPNLELLPGLREINLNGNQINDLSTLLLSPGSSLLSISISAINIRNRSATTSSFLLDISHKSPAIENLSLSGNLSSEILDFLKIFKKLQTVFLEFATSPNFSISSVIQDLGDLPYLHSLHLVLLNSRFDDGSSIIQRETEGFRALQVLRLDRSALATLQTLYLICEAPELREIYLSLNWIAGYPESATIEKCITECCRIAPNLETFELDMPERYNISPHQKTNPLASFSQCPRLVRVRLELRNLGALINDDQVRELGARGAFRNLRSLRLDCPFPDSQHLLPSLTSLRILAQSCPHLTDLHIPIDFRLNTLPSLLEEEENYPRTSHLLQLLVISKMDEIIFDGDMVELAPMAIAAGRFIEYCFSNIDVSKVDVVVPLAPDSEISIQWGNILKSSFMERRALQTDGESKDEATTASTED